MVYTYIHIYVCICVDCADFGICVDCIKGKHTKHTSKKGPLETHSFLRLYTLIYLGHITFHLSMEKSILSLSFMTFHVIAISIYYMKILIHGCLRGIY